MIQLSDNAVCNCIYVHTSITNCMFHGLTQGDALSSLLFNFPIEYVIRRLHVNQEGLNKMVTL